MAQSSNTLIVGVVVALVIGAAIGWFAYPAMNPIPSLEDYVTKSTYNALQTLYDNAETELEDVSSELSEAKSSLGSALAEGVLANIMLEELKGLTAGKKVGLVMATGGLGDKSFNDISYAGVQIAKEKLGIEFSTTSSRPPSQSTRASSGISPCLASTRSSSA